MGADGVAEVDAFDDFGLVEVDDVDELAVGADFADAYVAVDGNVGKAAVLAEDDFVSVDAYVDCCEQFAVGGIY